VSTELVPGRSPAEVSLTGSGAAVPLSDGGTRWLSLSTSGEADIQMGGQPKTQSTTFANTMSRPATNATMTETNTITTVV
jgi:hypothetical protein